MAAVDVCSVASLRELRGALDAHDDERDFCVVGCTARIRTVIQNLEEDGEDCLFYYARVGDVAEAEDRMAAAGWPACLGEPFYGPGFIYAIVVPDGMEEGDDYDGHYEDSEGDYGYSSCSRRRPVYIGKIYIGDGKNRNAQALVSGWLSGCEAG